MTIAANQEQAQKEAAIPAADKESVVASASALLNDNYYTRKELIQTLKDMGYENNTAEYGADHCEIEWTTEQDANY
ncbi:MAG: hypothetical protein J5973_08885 [Eubacterium sp.]|nr:hypothetical protein [Eubacterium sp.]